VIELTCGAATGLLAVKNWEQLNSTLTREHRPVEMIRVWERKQRSS